MKSVCLLSHRPGSTREAFREYYETSHSRLGSRYFPFSKYVRNHVVSSAGEVDFDVITEFFFDDGVDVAGVHSGRVREILDEDEKRFMDQRLIRPAGSEEMLLSGSARDIAPAGTQRQMLMLTHAGDAGNFRDAVNSWGKQLAEEGGLPRVSVDYTQAHAPSGEGRFPFDAVLSLWLPENGGALSGLSPPAALELRADVLTEVCESTPELLRELYAPETP
ncbi:EthD domain-containing protein [Haliea sp. E1-2-M8]|uniref:EthD domain-containing protein n=1 Tax=Haliea sp. E1-2-M8 TaxID=3064706 RepID=UPI002715B694|nr:EthD domain-containing protein [Haliea sp. E1-2-M8]MDO8862971.1 EthD domain-containing protein [Haliea sp. E1-2-M8]